MPINATGLELPTRQALPYPWQEKQGTLESVLITNSCGAPEQKRRCGMCCLGRYLGKQDPMAAELFAPVFWRVFADVTGSSAF